MSGVPRPAAPRPAHARNCRAPARWGGPGTRRGALGKSNARDVRQSEPLGDRRRDERRVPRGANGTNTTLSLPSSRTHVRSRAPGGSYRLLRADERDEASRGISEPVSKRLHIGIAAEKGRQRQGQRHAISSSAAASLAGARAICEERVTCPSSQVERRRQRAHGLDVGSPSFPALQRAHGMDRKTRNRRELLLREACGLAEGLSRAPNDPGAPVSWPFHVTAIAAPHERRVQAANPARHTGWPLARPPARAPAPDGSDGAPAGRVRVQRCRGIASQDGGVCTFSIAAAEDCNSHGSEASRS